MKLIWLTDIHLNFLDRTSRKRFYLDLKNMHGDAVAISGDIAEAPTVADLLTEMASAIEIPVYFVLGNHDYYRGHISYVRKAMKILTHTKPLLFWLPAAGIQKLTSDTLLAGQDGWADGRLGDYFHS